MADHIVEVLAGFEAQRVAGLVRVDNDLQESVERTSPALISA